MKVACWSKNSFMGESNVKSCMEFETPEQVTAFTHYVTEAHEDLSRDLEQLTAVRTGETSVFVIRVHKDQESYERYDMAGIKILIGPETFLNWKVT